MDKQMLIYTYNEIFSVAKMNEVPIHDVTWMNFKSIMLSEGRQT